MARASAGLRAPDAVCAMNSGVVVAREGRPRTHAPQSKLHRLDSCALPRLRNAPGCAAPDSSEQMKLLVFHAARTMLSPSDVATYRDETHAPQQTASLFDHHVGASKDWRWNGQTKRRGSLEIDDQLEAGWLLHRKVGRFGPS